MSVLIFPLPSPTLATLRFSSSSVKERSCLDCAWIVQRHSPENARMFKCQRNKKPGQFCCLGIKQQLGARVRWDQHPLEVWTEGNSLVVEIQLLCQWGLLLWSISECPVSWEFCPFCWNQHYQSLWSLSLYHVAVVPSLQSLESLSMWQDTSCPLVLSYFKIHTSHLLDWDTVFMLFSLMFLHKSNLCSPNYPVITFLRLPDNWVASSFKMPMYGNFR